ncbi:hypothetical protein [Nocardioides sp. WS12]|nr:hypothetical protein [Nocardioides sp. WS12]
MPKIKNKSGQDLLVFGRLVLNGQVIEVSDAQLPGLACQSIWEEVNTKES